MSRIAKAPVPLPQGVTATIADGTVTVKGNKGTLSLSLNAGVSVVQADKQLEVKYSDPNGARMQAGSTRAHLANMVHGVSKGYEKKLELASALDDLRRSIDRDQLLDELIGRLSLFRSCHSCT